VSALAGNSRTIRLADGDHEVLFTARRLIAIEDRYGSIAALNDAWNDKPTRTTAAVLFEGTGKSVPEAEVFNWLDGVPIGAVKKQLVALLSDCIGGGENADEANPTTPESATPGALS